MTIKQRSGIHVTGNGAAAVAQAVTAAGFTLATHVQNAGVVVVAQDGATPARTLAMQAIGLGQSVVSANPLLWALSGHQLSAAASAQRLWLGMEGALLGTAPLAPCLATLPQSLTAVFTGAADTLLQRLTHYGESPVSAEAQLRLLRQDMSDLHGKQSAARAAILGALAYGNWNLPTRRTGLENIRQEDIAWLTRNGQTLRYAVTVSAQGVTAAPTAFAAESPFATLQGSLLADDACEPATLFATTAKESARAHAGIVADLKLWQRRAGWTLPQTPPNHHQTSSQITPISPPSSACFYVRSPALFRTELMSGNLVVAESFGAGSSWQAILSGTRPDNPEVFVLPVQMPQQSAPLRATG